jgi:hypothetical protein
MARTARRPRNVGFSASLAGAVLVWGTACNTTSHVISRSAHSNGSNTLPHTAASQASSPDASAPGNTTSDVVEPNSEKAEKEIPEDRYMATLIQAGVAKYAWLEIEADGTLRGTPFGSWESMDLESASRAQVGSLILDSSCSAVNPPVLPTANPENRVHVLSRPKSCAKLKLMPRDETQVSLQWYGIEPNHRQIAVLRPTAVTTDVWTLILADSLLSPAGPWVALQNKDLDGDGIQDVAFVSQGVDGCDHGACPLFWINLLLSNTHTIVRSESNPHKQGFEASVLLDTADFEARTGLTYMTVSPSNVVWRSRAEKGRYEVSLHSGKRSLTWTALIEAGGVLVKYGAAKK